ncbi:MAG: PAS domain S-box protein [Ignavibacteriales bacterium]|nr:PAS domain S-box protein [Ignavibacteriales bacterium]
MGAQTKASLIKEVDKLLKENKRLTQKLNVLARKEENLHEENLFSVIFNNLDIGIALVGLDGIPIMCNKQLTKIMKYTEKELKNMTFAQFTHPHDIDADLFLFNQLIEGKRKSYKLEKRYIKKDGAVVWGNLTVSGVYDADHKLKYVIGILEDVTAQKEIEKKLAAEEKLLKILMHNIPDSIYFKDLESKFIKVNHSKARKHGFENPDDLIGKTDFDLFDKNLASQSYNDEQEIIKTNNPIIGKEEKLIMKDGREYWVSTTKFPLNSDDGSMLGTVGITRDITNRKETELKLLFSEERYRSLFETSADGIFLMTELFEDCNQAALELFRCSKEDLINHHPAEFSPPFQPDGRDSVEKSNEKIHLALEGYPQHFYWVHKRKDGTLVDVEVTLNTLTLQDRKMLQATVRNISERIHAEKAQKAVYEISEAVNTSEDIDKLYKKIHEIIGGLMPAKNFYIALYDDKTDMLSFPYFVDEYDPPQPPKKLGKGLTEYILRVGEPTLIGAKKDHELRERGEVELIGAPQAIWLGIPLKLAGKTIGVMVVQDYENEKAFGEDEKLLLTFVSEQIARAIERKVNADAIKKYAEELRQLNMTKDKFFSIIAHDLKNPFITILGFSDLLLSDYNDLSDDEKIFYIEEMKKSAEVSHNLLRNLLQWSRSQTGRIEFNPRVVKLIDLLEENIHLLKPHAQKKNIVISVACKEDLSVFADEDMVNTILRNLVTNAIKFTKKDGTIKIYAVERRSKVEISIEDNGVGIEEKVKNELFSIAKMHSTTGTDNEGGTGLGLVLCKEFVEKNHGTITVDSKLGQGTKFSFTLPAEDGMAHK